MHQQLLLHRSLCIYLSIHPSIHPSLSNVLMHERVKYYY
jgi:hypothetical protein